MLKHRIPGTQWAAISIVAASLLFIFLGRFVRKDSPPLPPSPAPAIVSVQGDVVRPGTYLLSQSTPTVEDAVRAAGGTLGGYHVEASDQVLRQSVSSGQQVRVLADSSDQIEIRFEKMYAPARLTLGEKLDLNEASEEELCLVPSMKPWVAAAIVSHRKKAPWKSLDELTQLSGVGRKSVEKWRDYLAVSDEN